MTEQDLEVFLQGATGAAARQGAFDLVLVVGLPPLLALAAEVVRLPGEPLDEGDIGALIRLLLEHRVGRSFTIDPARLTEAEFVADIPEVARYRVSIYRQRGTLATVLRPVSSSVPALESLGVPEQIATYLRRKWGFLLVAGPSAAGKSTTTAAMVEYINRSQTRHIISIENPVEYIHKRVNSVISQRSIPEDTPAYHRAVRAAMRQVPDVLVIGDIQDVETAAAALGAAESGHLVIAAVHSKDSSDAIRRLQSFFPGEQRRQVSVQIANTLLAILVQQLLTTRDERGRVLATEFLIATAGVRHMIRTDQTERLNTFMQSGRGLGMRTMEDSLAAFAGSGVIDYGEALTATSDANLFLNLFHKRVREGNQGIGRTLMVRRDQAARPGLGVYGAATRVEGTQYRADMHSTGTEVWSSNGLLRFEDGAICFRPDPFQSTLYAQITDYSIWLGKRLPFVLSSHARVIARGRLDGMDGQSGAAGNAAASRCRIWIVIMGTDGSVLTLPEEWEPGLEVPLNDLWHTLHFPISPELTGFEVKAYALRFSQSDISVDIREVLFH